VIAKVFMFTFIATLVVVALVGCYASERKSAPSARSARHARALRS